MLKSDIYNIFKVLVRMVRKSPMISTITIIVPIISGLLTFYSYAVQVNIINGVARGVMTLLLFYGLL